MNKQNRNDLILFTIMIMISIGVMMAWTSSLVQLAKVVGV